MFDQRINILSSISETHRQSLMSWFDKLQLPSNFGWGVGVILLTGLLVFMSKKLYENSRTDPKLLHKASLLINDAAKSLFSSTQTTNPLLAFSYATEALSFANVALRMAKDAELEKVTKLKVKDLVADIEQQERNTRERLLDLCPQAGSPSKIAGYAGYYGVGQTPQSPPVQTPQVANGAYVGHYAPQYGQNPQMMMGPPAPSGVAQHPMFTAFA